jgi:hypothetical protein
MKQGFEVSAWVRAHGDGAGLFIAYALEVDVLAVGIDPMSALMALGESIDAAVQDRPEEWGRGQSDAEVCADAQEVLVVGARGKVEDLIEADAIESAVVTMERGKTGWAVTEVWIDWRA